MNKSKTKKIVSIAALVLCIAMVAVFVFAFAGCDEENASADSGLTWGQERGYVLGGGSTYKSADGGEDIYEEMPETLNSEIVEPVYVENPNATITGEFDKNGVAPCVFRNTKQDLSESMLSGYGCNMCRGECKGHDGYISYDGYAREDYFYPYTIAPISMTAETAEIQFTLIFLWSEPEVNDDIFANFSFGPSLISLSSITGEPLDVANVTDNRVVYYSAHDTCGDYGYAAYADNNSGYRETSSYWSAYYHGAAEKDAQDLYPTSSVNQNSYWVYTVELANGDVYEYGINYFDPMRL